MPDLKGYAYEVWYWKLNPIDGHWSLWFRFTLLRNKFKSVAEVWGIFTQKGTNTKEKQTYHTALKNTFPIEQCIYTADERPQILLKNNSVDFMTTHGKLEQNEKKLYWNLQLTPIAPQESFNFVPHTFWKLGLVKNYAVTVHEKILFNGVIETNEETTPVQNALGMQGHLAGIKQGHSWAWAHSCIFYDEDTGELSPLIIDILTARARLGKHILSPKLTTMFIHYEGQTYSLNSLNNILSIKSQYVPQHWELQLKTNTLEINVVTEAEIYTIVGVQYEDTDGTPLYCYNTKMATTKLYIRDIEKGTEKRFICPNKGAFEWVQRELWDKLSISI
ncbi:MAG TPA: hypothetical protein PLT82_13065 [Candidatus Hydrogenedens sp.]|nr:hypothetical protein [Candidatus Hydrogenedens sp.]HOL20541.1 hypothetical protein [Candidatus Hydrogenedens sp.]HPP60053.1 hypothetical protein [Candidatus Hydrogenedens sp.]